ncbi:hypothetical protein QEN19_003577 [Hanseniaspora menglaensis]
MKNSVEEMSRASSPSPLTSNKHNNKIGDRRSLEEEYSNCSFLVSRFIIFPLKYMFTEIIKSSGRQPKHVSFIMDGNRRFAKNKKMKIEKSHDMGFLTMCKILNLLYDCDVKTVTVFAFSIENFSRSEKEVLDLMRLAKKRLLQLVTNTDMCSKFGVKVKVVGDISLLDEDLKEMCYFLESETQGNDKCLLNVCFPYTGRWELFNSMKLAITDFKNGEINDITSDTISEYIYNHGKRAEGSIDWAKKGPLDLLVRTSGVKRLSDYQLWQVSSDCSIDYDESKGYQNTIKFEILKLLWPELTIFRIIWMLLNFCFEQSKK